MYDLNKMIAFSVNNENITKDRKITVKIITKINKTATLTEVKVLSQHT